MILLEKEVNGETFKTDFDFDDKHIGLARDVLKCIEGKTVDVPDPSKKGTMIQIHKLAWLPVVCKSVSFDDAYGRYFRGHNLAFYAFDMWQRRKTIIEDISFGLSKYQANKDGLITPNFERDYIESINKFAELDRSPYKIVMARELKKADDAFRFVLAHEIQHAINNLKMVYPALINWEGFIFNVLEIEDAQVKEDYQDSELLEDILDNNTTKDELELLVHTFGNIIHTWYKGYKQLVDSI